MLLLFLIFQYILYLFYFNFQSFKTTTLKLFQVRLFRGNGFLYLIFYYCIKTAKVSILVSLTKPYSKIQPESEWYSCHNSNHMVAQYDSSKMIQTFGTARFKETFISGSSGEWCNFVFFINMYQIWGFYTLTQINLPIIMPLKNIFSRY